ncbi:PHP domain-containing protein [Natroniella acetigena]|uniref:PHP domain-containing protein n=1 Tax=Natroniella acetigena TaxID=52004 RepID=UPI002009E405|nr:PHP domain-containing protein [Natroniella acetigena]MCK8826521.1 PHP domain-containing protein [Natroniella acetigena]
MKKVDLHIHSSYSDDADFKPQELIKKAKEKGLAAIAIADHNVVGGSKEALRLTADDKLEVIPAIEFDTNYKDTVLHILGYYLNLDFPKISELVAGIDEAKEKRFYGRVKKLQQLGFAITAEEVLEYAGENGGPYGEYIVEILFTKAKDDKRLESYLNGEKSNQPKFNFMIDYFTVGGDAYVPCWKPSTRDTIKLINELGGVAVLAHPGSNLTFNDGEIIDDLVEMGLEGMEVYSTYHSQKEIDGFLELAKEKKLLVTAGSDFHGQFKPQIELGEIDANHYSIVEELKKLSSKK